ncbi:hypothetical protein LCGC14_0949940 [marine sediment metagenome]|uniref:Uncharacterized protein n=1 Tax=marine sediment metagenome TaxID=412755 RepID=A0A0F9P3Q9_9ZZZZ
MPKKITPLQIKNILKYYDSQVALGLNNPQFATAEKYKLSRQTIANYIKKRDNPTEEAPKDNINTNIREFIAYKELDKQFNEEQGGRIENVHIENIAKHLFEKYPKKAKKLLDKNYERALEQTFRELEIEAPIKDIEALKEGYSINDLLKSPPTEIEKLTQRAETEKKKAEIMKAKNEMYDMETDKYDTEFAQIIAKDGLQRAKNEEQIDGIHSNEEVIENPYFNKEFDEMWSEMSNLYLESTILHNPNVFAFKKRQFLLKWSYRLAKTREIKQLRAERKQEYNEGEQEILEQRLRRLPTEALEVLELVYNKGIKDGGVNTNRF